MSEWTSANIIVLGEEPNEMTEMSEEEFKRYAVVVFRTLNDLRRTDFISRVVPFTRDNGKVERLLIHLTPDELAINEEWRERLWSDLVTGHRKNTDEVTHGKYL